MAKLFISYRHADAGAYAGRLAEVLGEFHFESVFLDGEAIGLGDGFADRIREALSECDAVLVLIGRQWLDARDADGSRRLDREDDWVRREVTMALDADVLVVPVLFDSTPAPSRDELPEPMQKLASLHLYKLDGEYFERDSQYLCTRLERDLARRARERDAGRPDPPNPFRRQLMMIVVFLFLLTFGVAFLQARVQELPGGLWAFPAAMDFAAFAWWLYAGAALGTRRFS